MINPKLTKKEKYWCLANKKYRYILLTLVIIKLNNQGKGKINNSYLIIYIILWLLNNNQRNGKDNK